MGIVSKIEKLPKSRGSSLVERRPEKAGVASSILAPGTILSPASLFLHRTLSGHRLRTCRRCSQKETSMAQESKDQPVLGHIDGLVKEELDQCWDLLRQRRALREFGRDPDEAKVRPAKIVENYEQ